MYKVILILDKFFLKHEEVGAEGWGGGAGGGGGGGAGDWSQIDPPPRKPIFKKPSLIRVNAEQLEVLRGEQQLK